MPNESQPSTRQVSAQSQRRHELIRQIEAKRKSKVMTYVLGDRTGAQAQIAEDAVRPMYDHLRAIAPTRKIDLFLYSVGGHTDVPWRIVTMIREFAQEFNVLIPYKAMSAATMIALGSDQIVIGRKGELGPIDPKLTVHRGGREGVTLVTEQVAVEDIMSYLRFLKEKAGLTDQTALAGPLSILANKVDPKILGQIDRAHSHIRSVARKLLTSRNKKPPLDEQRIQVIVETLAEKTYQHGHAIGRKEAEEIGLNILRPDKDLEELIWNLHETYEDLCALRRPIDQRTFIPPGQDEHTERLVMGAIESVALSHHFTADLRARSKRQVPPQVTINLNLNLQLPPGVQPSQVQPDTQQAVRQMMPQLQQQAQTIIQRELRHQMPVIGLEAWTENGSWGRVEDWAGGA